MKSILTILAILIVSNTCGQTKNLFIEKLKSPATEQVFPFIIYEGHSKIAGKINAFLQLEELENIVSENDEDPFLKLEDNNYVVNYESWSKSRTVENILTLVISGNATGAYSEKFHHFYNFDLNTGKSINIKEVLTSEGLLLLKRKVIISNQKTIADFVLQIKSGTIKEFQRDQLDLYTNCIEDDDHGFYTFCFSKDAISFVRGRCSPHALRALDDIGEFVNTFSFEEIQPYLSDYGKMLLGNGIK